MLTNVFSVGQIMDAIKRRVTSTVNDVVPLVVAIADPNMIPIGVTLQENYPLTMIARDTGIPYGRFRRDATRVVSDPDELHICKWTGENHDAIFRANMVNQLFTESGNQHVNTKAYIALTTGLGNIKQNRRTIAFLDGVLHSVVGERPDQPPPYFCLVEHKDNGVYVNKMGFEMLLFNEDGGCQCVDKNEYLQNASLALSNVEKEYETKIHWAVSGYPLVIEGKAASLELTAKNVSDYRHVWGLPRLQESLVKHFQEISNDKEVAKRIEFYWATDQMHENKYFVPATREEMITLPIQNWVTEDWIQTICNVCKIDESALRSMEIFNNSSNFITLKSDELKKDFENAGYVHKNSIEDVQSEGDFFIDEINGRVSVKLIQAIYPHHIVGMNEDGSVVNISIMGLSGRSGITIKNAKELCLEIGLQNAVIFDNGFDVFAKIGGGNVICNSRNIRQTRLTGALHFGFPLNRNVFGGDFKGIDIYNSTIEIKK